jgi:Ca2+-binding EF-hand superfamily protein
VLSDPPAPPRVTTQSERVPDLPHPKADSSDDSEAGHTAVSYRFMGTSRGKPLAPTALPVLPSRDYYRSHALPSREEVRRHFRRLDLSGEGRLTYLTLKSALELLLEDADPDHYGRGVDDALIRSWLREHDHGAKGYVDWDDFVRIFASERETPQVPQYRYKPSDSSAGHPTASIRASRGLGAVKGETREKAHVDGDRIARIKRTFQKYDLNGDGLIDVDDLTKVFRATGRPVERDEIRDWVRERDSKGIGAVCFEDFLAHYA